ncbi:MAG: PEP/pyruvate-binding domain-containing protein [Candidatus Gracilibacteria bacterium]|jgi:pyruvate,water dikinase
MNDSSTIGAKTLKLSDLISLGLNVPRFKAINSLKLKENISNFESIAKKIHGELNCKKYAVRSSALIEDSKKESFAGQFKTKIDVDSQNLSSAIKEVTEHAQRFLGGSIEKFSIIIQEYIEADISGVTFTRNPTGGREMVIEYHKGRGEELVSGNIKPKKVELYWTDASQKKDLPTFNEAIENFKKIENFYKFPQDIEWCIKDNKWYFLQTRPITTISETEYKQSLYLDKTLPNGDFYYEKTEISEIAPRPTQITKDILTKIYEADGPIHNVYKKFKIHYSPINTLRIIGNELFVDREEELKTLLSIKNLFHIYRINLDGHNKIFQALQNAIKTEQKINTTQEFLEVFEKDYQIIFEINLLAGISIKKLGNLTKNNISLSLLLSHGEQLLQTDEKYQLDIETGNLIGNTIEISDESKFIKNTSNISHNNELKEWWEKLSEIKKTMLKKKIQHAIIYNKLREMGRWLVIKRINQLRELLFDMAEKNNFKDKREIYFAKLDEVVHEKISEGICDERRKHYMEYMDFNMPKILTNKPINAPQAVQGVSPGKVEGILVQEDEIKDEKYKNKDKILFTRVLSPELAKYFDDIKGIVSEQGGFLSHLAIIARERGLPVITGIEIDKIKLGRKIEIDGSNGKISDINPQQ